MESKLEVEYCEYCEDVYAANPIIWMCFNTTSAETSSSSDELYGCPRCGSSIERYSGYLDALQKRESAEYINTILLNIQDLTDKSKDTLRLLLANFTVPSFAVILEEEAVVALRELVTNRYIEIVRSNAKTIVVLNAYKLSLMDNLPLLEFMVNQRSFILNPRKLRHKNEHSTRRKERLEALVNDFTVEQREEVLVTFNHRCALTGKDVPLQFDHVIPVAVGHGGTTKSNILPIWQRINSSKGSKNIFKWYEQNGKRFGVCPDMFECAIEYLSGLNGMTSSEYRDYVYECHANPTEVR